MPSSDLGARMSFDQGREAYAAQRYDDAADHFKNAVDKDVRFLEAHRFLAESYEKLGYAHRARKAWEQLLRFTTDPAAQAEIQGRMANAGNLRQAP